ncbi:MAG: Crp/Fnr family transcriptional regulator, partial [Bacteroidota bacterium]
GEVQTWYVENNVSDSYNPKLVVDSEEVWLFYLNNQDQYYRLYARSFVGGRFSGEILLTPKEPFDVVTPEAVIGPDGEITIAWCEWMANQRFLKYRKMKNGIPGKIYEILAAPPVYIEGYTNAWWPSLVYLKGNEVWGAWNQHYPSTCGVYGGNLNDTALTVTQPSEAMDDREQGGYPDIFTDGLDLFVVWESDGWNVYNNNEPQKIKVARYDSVANRWTPGKVITPESLTMLNQTPSGACDSKGNKYIVWSGRNHLSGSPWGIYLAQEINGKWSDPVLISDKDETARHPKIVVDSNGNIWISWHSGTGSKMRATCFYIRFLYLYTAIQATMYKTNNKHELHCCDCSMKSPLFRYLRPEELELVDRSRRRVYFKSGEIIAKQGAPMAHVISFTSGVAKVYIQGAGSRNLILQFIKPTQFLGGPGIYQDSIHYFSVSAVVDSSVCFIEINVFKKIVRENVDFAEAFMKELSREGVFNYERFISLTHKNMPGRIADGLIYLHQEIFNERSHKIEIPRQDLADFTGMSKDSVIRTLKELSQEQTIELQGNAIIITDIKKLERISALS